MNEICQFESCCGCMACVQACAHKAISIERDKEGFERPVIHQEICVNCGLCKDVCPINSKPKSNKPIKVFSGWSNDESIRLNSSSGGAFVEIAKAILADGGVVFGCALNEAFQAEHIYVESIEDLRKLLTGSKYVQSHIGNSYRAAYSFLREGRKVLFSGTPCQIAGLKKYLRKEYSNLYTVDLICHGVPSPLIYNDYIDYMKRVYDMKITDIKFRRKKYSWIFFNMAIEGVNNKTNDKFSYIGKYYQDPYIRGFLRDYFLRPSCHQCQFTSVNRYTDFTIADWWGYKRQKGEKRDFERKGVSLLLLNTEASLTLLQSLKQNMKLRERTLEEAMKTNISLSRPFPPSKQRAAFWEDYAENGFGFCVGKYCSPEKLRLPQWVWSNFKSSFPRDVAIKILRVLDSIRQRKK